MFRQNKHPFTDALLLGMLAFSMIEPAVAQSPPKAKARVFEKGLISTGHEFTLTFSPDGRSAYFTRGFPEEKHNHVMHSEFRDGKWQEPSRVSFSDDSWSDLDPAVSPKGDRLYFVSTRPIPGAPDSAAPNMDIWYSDWVDDGWGNPVIASAINSPAKEGSPTATSDGTVCFFSDRDAEPNVNSIYCAKSEDGVFGDPIKLGPEINSGESDTSPFLSSDGQTMLFYSTRKGGYGGGDLYVSFQKDGTWSPAQNLGPSINTADWEYNPTVSRDGKTLYFGQARDINAVSLESLQVERLVASRFTGN